MKAKRRHGNEFFQLTQFILYFDYICSLLGRLRPAVIVHDKL